MQISIKQLTNKKTGQIRYRAEVNIAVKGGDPINIHAHGDSAEEADRKLKNLIAEILIEFERRNMEKDKHLIKKIPHENS